MPLLTIWESTESQLVALCAEPWLKKIPSEEEEGRRGGATATKVDDEMREAARDLLSENPAISIHDLNGKLRVRLPQKPTICDQHLGRVCKDMFFTLKKLEPSPVERNRADVKDSRDAPFLSSTTPRSIETSSPSQRPTLCATYLHIRRSLHRLRIPFLPGSGK